MNSLLQNIFQIILKIVRPSVGIYRYVPPPAVELSLPTPLQLQRWQQNKKKDPLPQYVVFSPTGCGIEYVVNVLRHNIVSVKTQYDTSYDYGTLFTMLANTIATDEHIAKYWSVQRTTLANQTNALIIRHNIVPHVFFIVKEHPFLFYDTNRLLSNIEEIHHRYTVLQEAYSAWEIVQRKKDTDHEDEEFLLGTYLPFKTTNIVKITIGVGIHDTDYYLQDEHHVTTEMLSIIEDITALENSTTLVQRANTLYLEIVREQLPNKLPYEFEIRMREIYHKTRELIIVDVAYILHKYSQWNIQWQGEQLLLSSRKVESYWIRLTVFNDDAHFTTNEKKAACRAEAYTTVYSHLQSIDYRQNMQTLDNA